MLLHSQHTVVPTSQTAIDLRGFAFHLCLPFWLVCWDLGNSTSSQLLPLLPQVGESSHLALRLLCSLAYAADLSHSLIAHRILAGQLSEPAYT